MTNTIASKKFARGEKQALARKLINDNLDKDFYEVSNMIAVALDLNKYAGRSYYKYCVKHGLVNIPADAKPWESAKSAIKTSKNAGKKVKTDLPVKKVKAPVDEKPAEDVAPTKAAEKPATSMIRDFIKKQKAAAQAA